MRKYIISLLLALLVGSAWAADIATMPSANQLKQGEVDVAAYYINLDMPAGAPQYVNYQTLYVGVTDWLEIDLNRSDVDKDRDSTIINASIKLLSETKVQPDLVIGARNLTGQATTFAPPVATNTEKTSYYVAAAKTFFLSEIPGPPFVRAHLGLGTEDWTVLNEKRHNGLFGGVQIVLNPKIGLVVQHDGTDLITGISYFPVKNLMLKGGTLGDSQWVGLSYQHDFY